MNFFSSFYCCETHLEQHGEKTLSAETEYEEQKHKLGEHSA